MNAKVRWAAGVLAVLGAHGDAAGEQAALVRAKEMTLGADLLPRRTTARPVIDSARLSLPAAMADAAPTVEEVGDVDSFKRSLRWLGVQQMNIDLLETCPPGPIEDYACQELAPAGTTIFAFEDVARIELPKKASNSILCHWFSPFLSLAWNNTAATPELGTLTYTPTLTVENPVLDDPTLINPQTGLPFGGSLLTGMTSSERIVVPLAAGMAFDELLRDSATCIAGFVSKRGLVLNYGLTEALADEFFNQPTVVRMNIEGTATHLEAAQLVFGLRIVGD